MDAMGCACASGPVSHATIGTHHDRPQRLERIMPDLPSGTVTFLFTDIEGSTALWERDQVAMAAAVARHLTLLRAATERHGGGLFKVVGGRGAG